MKYAIRAKAPDGETDSPPVVCLFVSSSGSDGLLPFGGHRWQRSAREKAELAKDVTWLTHEPLEFLMRRGDHFDDEATRYERMYQPENLKRMAAAGVRYGRLYFYKGFGLEYEKANMEKAGLPRR